MDLKKNYFKIVFTVLFAIVLLIFIDKSKIIKVTQIISGYEIGSFIKPSIIDISRLGKIDSLNYSIKNELNILYIPGRDTNFEIDISGKGYTRNLLEQLISTSDSLNFNLFYLNTSPKYIRFSNNIDSNDIEINSILELKEQIDLTIGISHGANIVEFLALSESIPGISIGGGLRNSNSYPKLLENYSKNWPQLIEECRLIYHVIGSKDGDFENNKTTPNKICVYKGHHYITSHAISCVLKAINSLHEIN